MEEPFRKRPRLSMFADQATHQSLDQDLDAMRYRNDSLLKSRLESIFEKYAKDFEGVGDEIDLDTGEIVVDNGHLRSMAAETDTGIQEQDAKGKALLRAMTEAADRENSYFNGGADDVIMSIEEIAENTGMTLSDDENTPEDSDEELFGPAYSPPTFATPPDLGTNDPTVKSRSASHKSESDTDSLFDVQHHQRSSSPDSLFEVQPPIEDIDNSTSFNYDTLLRDSSIPDEHTGDDAILAKYGPQVGQEVITMLRRARDNAEAHIEPAWRIPSNVIPPRLSPSLANPGEIEPPPPPSPQIPIPQETNNPPSPQYGYSLWKPPRVKDVSRVQGPKKNSHRERMLKRIRAESEDPLQEGFLSDRQTDREEHEPSGSEYEEDVDKEILALRESTCIYCGRKWKSRAGVVCHWARLVARSQKKEELDGLHNMEYIRAYRDITKPRIPRGPRLVLCDFRTMVEMHEGAGLSFAEIADCKALRTRKTGPGLVEVYDRYRIAPEDEEDPEEWSAEELRTLQKLCENPNRDLSTFSKKLSYRTDSDIAGKLAEVWLQEFRDATQVPQTLLPQYRRGSTEDPLFIKEESGDELFGFR